MDKPKPKRSQRVRRIVIVALITALGLALAEVAISRSLAWKLKETVADKLDAQLQIKSLWFVPPVGVYVSGATLSRDDQPIVQIGETELRLAQIPWFNRPMMIQSLDVDDPVLQISRTHEGIFGGPGFVKKTGPTTRKKREPKKLSDVLRLRNLVVRNGRITYTDHRPTSPLPMTWSDIDINTDLSQENVSRYAYRLRANSGAVGDISAAGTVDVDELMLKVDDLLLKLAARPDAQVSPLPAPAQRIIQRYEIRGSLTANARANLPLRNIDDGDYAVRLVLQEGSAFVEKWDLALDRVRTTIEIEKPAPTKKPATGPALAEANPIASATRPAEPATQPESPPVVVRLLALDATSGNAQLIMDRGKVWLDLTHGDWAIADLSGHIVMTETHQPTSTRPDNRLVLREDRNSSRPYFYPRASTRPTARDIVRRLAPAGHIDFTAAGSGPLAWAGKSPKTKVADYQVIAYPRDVSFAWRGFGHRFENIGGGNVRLQHNIITLENLNGRYGNDLVRLKSARIPLDGIREAVQVQEINSAVVFNLPLEDYPEAAMKMLKQFTPTGTYLVAGNITMIPQRRGRLSEAVAAAQSSATAPSTRPIFRDYNLMISTDTGGLVFSDYQIPVTNLRADVIATPTQLTTRNAQGKLLGGDVAASLDYQRGDDRSSYDARIVIREARLEELDSIRKKAGQELLNMKGRVFANGALRGAFKQGQSPVDVMTGSGDAEIIQGEIFKLPVLSQLLSHVKGVKSVATVGEAATSFSIGNRTVTLTNTAISSPLVGIQGHGTINFDGPINARAIVAPLADWRDKIRETRIPFVSDLAGELVGGVQKLLNSATSNLLYQFRIEGDVKNPKITPIPAPVLTDSAAFVFGKMVQGVRDGELLRTVKRAPEKVETPKSDSAKQ